MKPKAQANKRHKEESETVESDESTPAKKPVESVKSSPTEEKMQEDKEFAKIKSKLPETEKEFMDTEKALEFEIASVKSESHSSMKEIMDLLHEYNDIKDATQVVLGAIAGMRGVTIASLHEEFDLPMIDE